MARQRKRMRFGQHSGVFRLRQTRDPSKERMYEGVWNILKKDYYVVLEAPEEYHKRIRHMLWKEKDEDVAYKFMLRVENGVARLKIKSTRSKMEVWLVVM